MKRKIIIITASLVLLLISAFAVLILAIRHGVKERIEIAQEKYQGNAEDALIAWLLDTTNTPQARSDVAVWTLGQIQSQKALPILKDLYKSDPEGKSCHGKHDSVLCQYEIYKAIRAIESTGWPLHAKLNK
jgi:hypothetical protein